MEPTETLPARRQPASYAVIWREAGPGASRPLAGKLELLGNGLSLEGGARDAPTTLRIAYPDLVAVTVRSAAQERLHGLPSLRLDWGTGHGIHLASLAGTGVLLELASRLSSLIAV